MDRDRKALIGHTFPPCRCVLDEENVRDYIGVVGERHPAFSSEAGARTEGYQRRVIPPSYAPLIALSSLLRTIDWAEDFGLDYSTGTSMFGEQEMVYRRPLYLGETLNIAGTVVDVIEKQGKRPFDLVTIGVAATDEAGVLAFSGSMGFIIFK
jgi:N-terminal half of MaoC dehydratase